MAVYGYARVSTDGQTLASQDAQLHAAGCAKVYSEKVSGAKTDRPALAKLLRRLEPGDVLVVTRLDRLARSTRDLLNILDTVAKAGAGFKSLSDAWADTTTAHGRLMLNRGQFVPGGKGDDQITTNHRQRARRHDKAAIRGVREGGDGTLDLGRVAHVDWARVHANRRRHGLDYGELADPGGKGGIPKDRRSRYARRDLPQQFRPFPAQTVFEHQKAGGVAAWPRQTIDEAGTNRIGDEREYDRHSAGYLEQRLHGRANSQDDVRRKGD
jgi:Resolvase, N terminal domain